MFLKPEGRTDLEHRAYFLRGAPHRSAVIAAAEDGRFSVLTSGLKVSLARNLPGGIRAVHPHPSDRRLALVPGSSGSLVVQDFEGSSLLEIAPPQLDENAPNWVKEGFEDCHFDEAGDFLWLAARRDVGACEIWLIETKSWSTIDKLIVTDPFGGSSCSFHRTGRPALLSLWMAAGQDGQQVYWVRRERGAVSCALAGQLTNAIPPVFSPGGEHVLVVNEHNAICKYDFPEMRQIGTPLEHGDEDDPFGCSLCYLDGRYALVHTNEGRVFAVDTLRMEVQEEVSVEGHEPRPLNEYYPTLAKERGLGTDISYFARLGDVIIFVYRLDQRTGSAGWKDALLWLSANPPSAAR